MGNGDQGGNGSAVGTGAPAAGSSIVTPTGAPTAPVIATGSAATGTPGPSPTGTSGAAGTPTPAPAPAKPLKASIYQHGDRVGDLLQLVRLMENELKMPVWMLVQNNDDGPFGSMTDEISDLLRYALTLTTEKQIAVLVHSPGGSATCAYHLGTAFADRDDGYMVIIPRMAKSAATLMSLGARKIILGRLGELGPLDAQIFDSDREQFMSALDEVQSLERLHKFALDALDQTMSFLAPKTLKKVDTILPLATQFVHGMVQPLFASIDVVHYTQLSRTLKVAEDYAVRLMEPRLGRSKAVEIANRLISSYPEHGFVIDLPEIERIGLDAEEADGALAQILDAMVPMLSNVSAIGRVET